MRLHEELMNLEDLLVAMLSTIKTDMPKEEIESLKEEIESLKEESKATKKEIDVIKERIRKLERKGLLTSDGQHVI